MMYLLLKTIHISCALLSISGFILRGYWTAFQPELMQMKVVKILPHIIDTVFLFSGIALVLSIDIKLFGQGWLIHKILLLFVYIYLGATALGHRKSKTIRVYAFFGAILVFIYIVGIATSKTAMSWFSFLV